MRAGWTLCLLLLAPEAAMAGVKVGKLVISPEVRHEAEGHKWREGFQQARKTGHVPIGPHGFWSKTETPIHRDFLVNELDEKVWIQDSIYFPQKDGAGRKYDFYGKLWKRFHYFRVFVHDNRLVLYLEIEMGGRKLSDCALEPLGGYYQLLARFDPGRRVFVVDRYGTDLDAAEFYNKIGVDERIRRLLKTARPLCGEPPRSAASSWVRP